MIAAIPLNTLNPEGEAYRKGSLEIHLAWLQETPTRLSHNSHSCRFPEIASTGSIEEHPEHPPQKSPWTEERSFPMPALLSQEEFSSNFSTTTAFAHVIQNGTANMEKDHTTNEDLMADRGMADDIFDETYREKEGPKPAKIYVWRNIILMSLLHMAALYSVCLIPAAKLMTLAWASLCFVLSGLGVTAGAHRLWSHRSYKATLPLRIFLAVINSMAFQNDIYEWARDHRVHHKFSETDADPHNASRGFFFSHIGWLLVRKHPDVIEKGKKMDLSDLKADKVVMFQRRHYKTSVVIMCFIMPAVVPWYFWGETFSISFLLASILRYTLILNATWLVNSAAHMYGNRPYDKNINPRENHFVVMGALGEGFHNFHHTFPFDYATSEFGWRFNVTTAFIDAMSFLGLASDCKTAKKETIMARKIRTGDGSHKTG